jgi:hypothetical protein
MVTNENEILKYCYWLDDQSLTMLKKQMEGKGIEMGRAEKNPCEALKIDVAYAEPHTWDVICKHDAAPWYHASEHAGKNLVASSFPLEQEYEPFLETTIELSTFKPEKFPSEEELRQLATDSAYLARQPEGWGKFPAEMGEAIVEGLSKMIGKPFGKFEDLLRTWTAVHANFVNPRYRAGQECMEAPYSVANTTRISSCCAEIFNLVDTKEKAMLVRPCIGAVIVNVLKKDQYYLVRVVSKR